MRIAALLLCLAAPVLAQPKPLSAEQARRFVHHYHAGTDPRSPYASPLYGDLSGLPPLLLQCGSEEMLRDDSVRLAARAKAAGVDVTFEEWDAMIHVWHLFADRLADGRKALTRVGEFVRAHIAR